MTRIIVSIALFVIASSQAISQRIDNTVSSQTPNRNIDSAVAMAIANRLKDSLSLTQQQANAIGGICQRTRIEKKQVWSQYRSASTLQERMRQEDNRRDSLIKTVIGDEKYNLYIRKRWLLLLTN